MKKFEQFIKENNEYKGIPIKLGGVQLYYNQHKNRFWLYKEDESDLTMNEVRTIKESLTQVDNIRQVSFIPYYMGDLDINEHDVIPPKMPNLVALYIEDDMIDRMILGFIESQANSSYEDL